MTLSNLVNGHLKVEGLSASQLAQIRSQMNQGSAISVTDEAERSEEGVISEAVLSVAFVILVGFVAAKELVALVAYIHRLTRPSQMLYFRDGELCHSVMQEDAPRGLIICVTSQGERIEIHEPEKDSALLTAITKMMELPADGVAD